DPDHLLVAPDRAQATCEKHRARQCATEAELWGASVCHRKTKRIAAGRLYERAMQRSHIAFAEVIGVRPEVLYFLAHALCATRGRHGLPERDCDRIWNLARKLPQEPSAFKAED